MAQLILLGQGPSMKNCPFDTPVWTAASVLSHKEWADKPYEKIFCFDNPDRKEDELKGLEVAKRRGLTVIGMDYISYITEAYPLAEMQERFDTYYFKNDMSYMIAYALSRGYKSLSLWGVDQGGGDPALESVYAMARPYVMFWLGIADGMGVKWSLAPDSILLRSEN